MKTLCQIQRKRGRFAQITDADFGLRIRIFGWLRRLPAAPLAMAAARDSLPLTWQERVEADWVLAEQVDLAGRGLRAGDHPGGRRGRLRRHQERRMGLSHRTMTKSPGGRWTWARRRPSGAW